MAFPLKNDTKIILSVTAVSYLDYRSSLGEGWRSDCFKTIKLNPKSLRPRLNYSYWNPNERGTKCQFVFQLWCRNISCGSCTHI